MWSRLVHKLWLCSDLNEVVTYNNHTIVESYCCHTKKVDYREKYDLQYSTCEVQFMAQEIFLLNKEFQNRKDKVRVPFGDTKPDFQIDLLV